MGPGADPSRSNVGTIVAERMQCSKEKTRAGKRIAVKKTRKRKKFEVSIENLERGGCHVT
jgi:uncharacterized lipoprotein